MLRPGGTSSAYRKWFGPRRLRISQSSIFKSVFARTAPLKEIPSNKFNYPNPHLNIPIIISGRASESSSAQSIPEDDPAHRPPTIMVVAIILYRSSLYLAPIHEPSQISAMICRMTSLYGRWTRILALVCSPCVDGVGDGRIAVAAMVGW